MISAFNFFFVPCVSLIVVFWLGFGLTYYLLRERIVRVELRVARIERSMSKGQTEDLPQKTTPLPKSPRPVVPSRYITVDRQPNPRFYR